ncbi:hypothetical protein Dimus_015698 [Dionaea muscipula]
MEAGSAPLESSTKPTKVVRETVKKAVKALQKWRATKSLAEKPQLLSSNELVFLVVTLYKIPFKGRTNAYKIPLPHPLHSFDESSEFCLFIDDRHGRLSSKDAKEKIDAEGIPISKVIKLSKLKTDFKGFEAKRKLCDSFDMFFADKRVIPLLPKLLGKHFYKKKKIPVPIELEHKNWKQQIEKVCGSAMLFLGTGTCSLLKVARVSMMVEEIVENVVAAINGMVEIVPKAWANVRSLHLKLPESLALPVYQRVPEMNLSIAGLQNKEGGDKVDDGEKKESNNKGDQKPGKKPKRVVESSNKKSKRASKKGKIHDIQYIDSGVVESLGAESDHHDVEMSTPVENEKSERKADVKPKKTSNGVDKLSDKKSKGASKKKMIHEIQHRDRVVYYDSERNTLVEDEKAEGKVLDTCEIVGKKRKKTKDTGKRSTKSRKEKIKA